MTTVKCKTADHISIHPLKRHSFPELDLQVQVASQLIKGGVSKMNGSQGHTKVSVYSGFQQEEEPNHPDKDK